jgi:hypothetical protein
MKGNLKRVIIEELLRVMAILYFTMMGWAYLASRGFLPASGYSFAAVALGIPFLSFWIILSIRLRTGWELKLRGWRGWITMALVLAVVSFAFYNAKYGVAGSLGFASVMVLIVLALRYLLQKWGQI